MRISVSCDLAKYELEVFAIRKRFVQVCYFTKLERV